MAAKLLSYICLVSLLTWMPAAWGKVYKNNITKKTPRLFRVWGGMNSNSGDNFGGWLVGITNGHDGGVSCGGAYYSPLLVITSANCMQNLRYSLDEATVFGTAIHPSETVLAEVDTVYTPDDFVVDENHMDIAVVRLLKPLPGRLTEFIRLCNNKKKNGGEMMAFSWYYSDDHSYLPSDIPLKHSAYLKNLDACANYYNNQYYLSNTSLCVNYARNSTLCGYNQGSPLVWRNQLCGVVSLGPWPCEIKKPGIYTNIVKVKEFIEKVDRLVTSGKLV